MKKFANNCLLILFSLTVSFAVLEVLCRFLTLSNDTDPTYKLAHDVLPYTMKPNTEATSVMGNSIKINQHGLRDFEYSFEKQPNTLRILVLGDSSTFAYGNKMEDGFTKVLERKLNNLPKSRYQKFEVINTGHPGYNTTDEFNYLRLLGLRYSPDLIVVATMTNDFLSDSLNLAIKDGVDSRPGSIWLAIPSWVKRLLRQSRLYVALGYIRVNMGASGQVRKPASINDPSQIKKLNRSKKSLEGILAIAKENRLPIIFISLPNRYETQTKAYIAPEFYKQVSGYAHSDNVTFINMLKPFSEYADRAEEIFAIKDSSHPNAVGHAMLAKHLYKSIVTTLHLGK